MDDSGLSEDKDEEICNWLREQVSQYDLVIAADFGHGTISDNMVKILREYARILAVNTQANAGNRGFHTVSRYPEADYVCIAEHEIRLELRDLKSDVTTMMYKLLKKLDCSRMMVTRGIKGCAVCEKDGFVKLPAFSRSIVDTIGAGDAVFSVTAAATAMGNSRELVGFIGNVVGALAIGILGNKKSIDKLSVQK